uniref:Subtilisin-like protease fibronectin type-III domain-containing protein n=1 Tax=Fagus sylvatica TaxID=28930 RepID=A0A2N9HNH7_FAGSY
MYESITKCCDYEYVGMDGVVSVFPNKRNRVHTTRSWDFVGFPKQVHRTTESNIIIGILDTGIWPESDSFNDKGFGPPPSRWKGTCKALTNFTCNNKIIGAQYYHSHGNFGEKDIKSPRDSEGHGTHVSSTAAGNFVSMASLQGLGLGTARGGLPSARIAVYKICWSDGCSDADTLAAFDDAIADVMATDINAMRNGILTSTSAGNEGPGLGTVTNFAPWLLSVAASSIDRKFFTEVQLGNKKSYEGFSINTFDLKNEMYPIIYGRDAPNTAAGATAFMPAGAVGTVMQNQGPTTITSAYPLPASQLSLENGGDIYSYINSTRNPTATILKSIARKDTFAPYIAGFSSRGPNPAGHNILKPDLAAPGVEILAAWSPISPISGVEVDKRSFSYNIISGTSMSCPHATGVAAYVKSLHPKWSPAAITSALMTTAVPMSAKKNPDAEFAYGAGNINPLKASNPGLIYDIDALDYIKFLCAQGYHTTLLRHITGDKSICPEGSAGTAFDLNYPSIALSTPLSKAISHVFNRTVTNVGSPTSTYKAIVTTPPGLSIKVNPSVLSFTSLGQKLSFTLTIEGTIDKQIVSASLIWDDGAAAYIKSLHPTWSPAAIRSALMTTVPMSAEQSPGAEFAYGFSTKLLQAITGDKSSCPEGSDGTMFDLNYPSFALFTLPSNSISHVFIRTVTNVGLPTCTYKAIVTTPPGLSIKVNPSVLSFTSLRQKLSISVTIEGTLEKQIFSASLIWDDDTLRSPIVVYGAF